MAATSKLTTNMNYLQPTGYKVTIDRKYYPNLEFFCQTFQHPGMSQNALEVPIPRLAGLPFEGEKLMFGELVLTVIVDEALESYSELYSWMDDLVNNVHVPTFERTATKSSSSSDISVGILNSHNNVSKTLRYINCVPTLLGDLNFETIAGGESFLTFPASFRFAYFEIK